MAKLRTTAFAQELARTQRATRYYERFVDQLSQEEHALIARYYGVGRAPSAALLRFKALFFATRLEPVLAHIEDFVARQGRPPRTLDLGCGYGLETTLLAATGADVTGVDTSRDKVERARQLAPVLQRAAECEARITYQRSSVFDYAPDKPYDLVYSSATLHHIEPAAGACRAVAGLVAPGGFFFLSDENGLNPLQQLVVQRRIGWLSRRVVSVHDPATGENRRYGNENIRPAFLWRRHLRAAGLHSRGIRYCRMLPPLAVRVSLLLRAERALRDLPLLPSLAAVGFVEAFQKATRLPTAGAAAAPPR